MALYTRKFAGWGNRKNQIDIDKTVEARTKCVIRGFMTANLGTDDYSRDAYFWDGVDIRTNFHYTQWGVTYSDQKHNIYNLPDKPIAHKKDRGTYYYTLISTHAVGGTIFWKYTNDYKEKEPHGKEYP